MRRRAWQLIALLLVVVLGVIALAPSIEPGWIHQRSIPPQLAGLKIELCGALLGPFAVITIWRPTRFLVTLLHELGHALTAALLGGHPIRVTIASDSSGRALSRYSPDARLGPAVVAYAGYVAPGIAAVGGAAACRAGNAQFWVLVTAVFLVLALLGLARSLAMGVVTLGVIGATGSVMWWVPWAAPGIAGLLVGIWGLGGIRCAQEQFRSMSRTARAANPDMTPDSVAVQQRLGVPAYLVATSQLIASIALGVGAALLVARPPG